jgi:predicted ATPase
VPPLEPEVFPNTNPATAKESPLIDRVKEMDLLKEAADKAISDQGGLIFLYGEAGIGKTRLTKEVRAYARQRGMQILYGRCLALFRMDGVPPYSPWKEVIKEYLQISTPEQLQRAVGYYPGEIYKIVPEIRQKLVTFSESPPLSPDFERDRLFEAVSQFVTNISKMAPLLVVLDDLQWADSSSLLLLHYLARGVYRENLLLLGAYRDTDVEEKHPLSPVLTELNRARLLQSVQLKRMSHAEVTEMIKQILGQSDVPEEFCKIVYEKTDGNPFFVEEVIASLKEEGAIVREDDKFKISEVSAIEFPKTVKDVLKARLGRLDEECQQVLTMASFVGNDFTFEILREVTGIEENKLLQLMEKILKTGLLRCRVALWEDACSFADVLVRDVLYEEVNPLRRKKLHNVVGCALEKVYSGKISEHLGELASHFLESGDKDKALDYFLKAGEKAANIYANNEAASYYQSALRLLEEKEGSFQERARVFEVLGDIKGLVGDYDACLKCWDEALKVLEQLGEKEKVARLSRKTAYVLWVKTGNLEKAKEYFCKAQEILEAQPESSELASLYADMAEMQWRSFRMDEASALVEKALQIAKKSNAYQILANSYLVLAKIICMDNRRKASECSEEALKIALEHGFVNTAVDAYSSLANPFFGSDNIEKRLDYAQKGYELAKKVGAVTAQSWIGVNLSGIYRGMGDTDSALPLSEESVALNRKTGNLHYLALSLLNLGHLYAELGEWDKSEEYLKEALMVAQKTNDVAAIGNITITTAFLLFEKGDYAEARESIQKAYNQAALARMFQSVIGGAPLLAHASIELGELEKAENIINNMQQRAQEQKMHEPLAHAYEIRGKLFRVQKKWNESIEYYEKSLQEHRAASTMHWNVYIFAKRFLWEYAQVYVERNQEGDKQKALNLLNQALEIYQKMYAKKEIDKVKAQIVYLQTGRVVSLEPVIPVPTGYVFLDRLLGGGLPPQLRNGLDLAVLRRKRYAHQKLP